MAVQLLSNPYAQALDFLPFMRCSMLEKTELRVSIITRCAELFDLEDSEELLIFANWLIRVQD